MSEQSGSARASSSPEAQRDMLQEMMRVFAEASPADQMLTSILRIIGEHCGWSIGVFWAIENDALTVRSAWRAPGVQALAEAATKDYDVLGLAGLAWSVDSVVWSDARISDSLREHARARGICSGVAFPVWGEDGIIGIIEFLSPLELEQDDDLAMFLILIGRQIGQYLEALHSRERLETILDVTPDAIIVQDESGKIVYANQAAANLYDFASGTELSTAGADALYERFDFYREDGTLLQATPGSPPWFSCTDGETVQLLRMHSHTTGRQIWLNIKSCALQDHEGRLNLVINISEDITARRSTEIARQRALAEMNSIVEGVADSITTMNAAGELTHANPEALLALGYPDVATLQAASSEEVLGRLNFRDEDELPFPVEELPSALVQAGALKAEAVLRYQHAVHGDRWGLIRSSAVRSPDGEHTMTLTISEDVTAQKNEEHKLRNVAESLQASILPDELPVIPGAELGVAFTPCGGAYHKVGGDFYDAFALDSESWMLLVGDVCGKGPRAAAVTASCRYTVRALALHEHSPAALLTDLNEALLQQGSDGRFATVAIARLVADDEGLLLTLALGGHPQPYVLRADGAVEAVGLPGTLVGAFQAEHLADECLVRLHPGDTLLFYTDGATEARNSQGENFDLAAFLTQCRAMGAEEMARTIEQAVLDFQDQCAADDLALIAVRAPERPLLRERFQADPASVPASRRALDELIVSYPLVEWDQVKLMATELVTNSIKHGHVSWFDLVVSEREKGRLRVSIIDPGHAFKLHIREAAPDNMSGRGLYLVDALSDRWGYSHEGGTCFWFEVLVVPGSN